MNFKNLILFTFLVMLLGSCSLKNDACNATYFGGQIVNPKQNFVTLSKNDVVIDTMYLDKENRFLSQIDVQEEGLYKFRHSIEYQYVYIQPKDSILIRLNTWDFDESLVFSGRGAEKNNFLISLYLKKESLSYAPYYKLSRDEFETKIETSFSENNLLYTQLKESGIKITPNFNKLAEVAINFPLYRIKEIYSWRYYHRHSIEDKLELSSNFFKHRDEIDLNNEFLSSYNTYYNYVNTYLYGLAMKKSEDDKTQFVENHLNIIVENIKVENLKNFLLFGAIKNDFRKSKGSCSLDINGLKIFEANCTNDKYIAQINSLKSDCQTISLNNFIDDFDILNNHNDTLKINSIIKNNKTVIYFWSPEIISPNMLVNKVKKLEDKFPDLLFVGINMNPSPLSDRVHKKIGNQYSLTKESSAHNFIKSLEPRTILIDQKGKITNSFTYLTSPYFEKQLSGL